MTTTTLRPDGTIDNGGSSVTGAATRHLALNDDSDASYLTCSPSTFPKFDLGTFTLPAGAVTKSVAVRARARTSGSFGFVTLEVRRTPFSSLLVFLYDAVSGSSFAEFSGSPVAVSLTQAEIDSLQVWAGAAISDMQVSEAYVDIIHVPIPVTTVTAVTPDPYTASNLVPITWVNTLDADGGTQTRYQVRVFTAAQYGAGGFDASTSDATWDSGDTLSGSTTATTGALATGTTYRAYVRVAQTVNGVAHWGAYAYDEFTVTVTTAIVETLTTVESDATASITITAARDTTPDTAWEFIEVQRSTDGGTVWSDVRSATYVAATGDSFEVVDYEVANAQTVVYRARATRILSTLPITGEWVESTPDPDSWTSTSAWLKSPSNPSRNLIVDIDTPFVATALPVRAGVFDIIGSAERVVISDVMSSPGSTLMIRTEPSDITLLALLRDLVLLYHPTVCEGGTVGRYISITGVSFTPTVINGHVYQLWTVPYVEIDAPRDPLASAP